MPEELLYESEKYYNDCVLCEKAGLKASASHIINCKKCPIYEKEGVDCFDEDSSYYKWNNADDVKTIKVYAGKLLKIMKKL